VSVVRAHPVVLIHKPNESVQKDKWGQGKCD
jgi:hypothetical protein